MDLKETLGVIRRLESDGIIENYAIGGAIGAAFYLEPAETEDVDIFVPLHTISGGSSLVSLEPIYRALQTLGGRVEGQYIVISGWPVQFLTAGNPLVEEAITQAIELKFGDMPVKVMTAEHLAASALQLNLPKGRQRLIQFLESDVLDLKRFQDILERHDLTERFLKFKRLLWDQE